MAHTQSRTNKNHRKTQSLNEMHCYGNERETEQEPTAANRGRSPCIVRHPTTGYNVCIYILYGEFSIFAIHLSCFHIVYFSPCVVCSFFPALCSTRSWERERVCIRVLNFEFSPLNK